MEIILIGMTDYVLAQTSKLKKSEINILQFRNNIGDRANLLKQELNERYQINGVLAHWLNRFIPCDLDGNILEEPNKENRKYWRVQHIGEIEPSFCTSIYYDDYQIFKQAKDRVIFEGFEIVQMSHNLKVIINTNLSCQVMASKFK